MSAKRYVMQCIGFANGSPGAPVGQYLVAFDSKVTGVTDWSPDPGEAMTFESGVAVVLYRQTRLESEPTRNGRPNRPLLAFAVEVMSLDDALDQWEQRKRKRWGR